MSAPDSPNYRPDKFSLSNSEVYATGVLAQGAVLNISRELLAARERIAVLEAQVQTLREALMVARPRMAHAYDCVSVFPANVWAERGSVGFDGCKCEIATVDAALAATKKEKA